MGRETKTLGNSLTVLGVTLVEDLDLSFLDISVGILEMSNDVVDQVISLGVVHDLSEEISWLLEVAVGVLGGESEDVTLDLEL